MTNFDMAIQEVCALRRRLDEVKAELAKTAQERDELANALWSAEDQWGDDYLWDKWNLSKALTKERKEILSAKGKP